VVICEGLLGDVIMALRTCLAGLWAAALLCGAASAQAPPKPALVTAIPASASSGPVKPGQAAHALTREDLEPWLDGLMNYALERGDVAGATIAVVKDGQPLFKKGYGYADVAKKAPVTPDTMFRIGSIGKLFTWTAVMQLVEQHKINLDRDVNDYLDFKIPPAFGKPVTMRELLQHTAGFQEEAKYIFVDGPKHLMPLDRYLKENAPARIFPPGETPAYSNYGATLAGYIVQRVSGEPYEAYVQRHVFAPLGMDHSTVYQPPPPALAGDVSQGYKLGSEPPKPYEYGNVRAAGISANSGADMARFMLAHLNDGRLGSAQILQPATAELMHRQSFQATPPLPGFALGFYHEDRNGHDVIAHEGDTNYMHSNLELVLDQHVGFFISLNSLGKDGAAGAIRNAAYNAFMDRYFPAPPLGPEPTYASAKQDGPLVAGDYQLSRRIQTSLLHFVYLMGQTKITQAPDGTLTVAGINTLGGAPKHWREIGPYLWRDTAGRDRMAAKVVDGKVQAVWFDETVPAFVLQPVPASQDKSWILPLLGVSAALLTILVLAWPIAALARRRYGGSFAYAGRRALAYRLVRVVAILDVAFVVGMVMTIISTASNEAALDGGSDGAFRFFQLLGLLGLAGLVVGPWNLAEVWRNKTSSWWAKLTAILVTIAFFAISYLGFAIHLLTTSVKY